MKLLTIENKLGSHVTSMGEKILADDKQQQIQYETVKLYNPYEAFKASPKLRVTLRKAPKLARKDVFVEKIDDSDLESTVEKSEK